ncbi:unnamed protein product, partial [Rotaria sp. Silwood2]
MTYRVNFLSTKILSTSPLPQPMSKVRSTGPSI